MKKIYILSLIILILSGCDKPNNYESSSINKVEEDNLHKHIKILASDEFGGRGPGSIGGEKLSLITHLTLPTILLV